MTPSRSPKSCFSVVVLTPAAAARSDIAAGAASGRSSADDSDRDNATRHGGACAELVRVRAGQVAPALVWQRWTTPDSWASWDLGLRSAELDVPFTVGARGTVVDRAGRTSSFTVVELHPYRRCVVEVLLPAARLRLERTMHDGVVRHDVRFTGPLGLLFAALLAPSFRRLLPGAVSRVAAAARPPDTERQA